MKSITDQLETLIKAEEKNTENDEILRFIEASKQFDQLVSKGLIQKRGYTLMSLEEMYRQSLEKFYIANKKQVKSF